MLEQLNKTPIYDANIPAKYAQKCMSEARFIFRRKKMDDHDYDYDECMKVIHQAREDLLKKHFEKPNPELDESIRDLTDMEFFLLSMLVLTDIFSGQNKEEKDG